MAFGLLAAGRRRLRLPPFALAQTYALRGHVVLSLMLLGAGSKCWPELRCMSGCRSRSSCGSEPTFGPLDERRHDQGRGSTASFRVVFDLLATTELVGECDACFSLGGITAVMGIL